MHSTEKTPDKIYVSQEHIAELEAFFKGRRLPPDPITLEEGVFIKYPHMFVEGYMFILKDAYDKKWVVPYYYKLARYATSLGFLSGQPTISESPSEQKKIKKEKTKQPEIPIHPIAINTQSAPQRQKQNFFKANSLSNIINEGKVEPPKSSDNNPEQISLF